MRLFFAVIVSIVCWVGASAQLAVKTNLLNDAATTPNLGLELGVAERGTVNLVYGLNLWTYGKTSEGVDRKAKHWVLMPEYRWWFCTRYNGNFVGIHALTGQFNASNMSLPVPGAFFAGDNLQSFVRHGRAEGTFAGVGFTYGYQWQLSRHWNLEAEVGCGYAHVWNRLYNCGICSNRLSSGHSNYVGLTKLGISIIYLF